MFFTFALLLQKNIYIGLQNLQFLLGAESCFVDTCQLVVIQLPVQISELNISDARPGPRGEKKRPNMDNTRRSFSQSAESFTLLHIRIDIRQRQERNGKDELVSLESHVCLSLCLYRSFQTSHESCLDALLALSLSPQKTLHYYCYTHPPPAYFICFLLFLHTQSFSSFAERPAVQ